MKKRIKFLASMGLILITAMTQDIMAGDTYFKSMEFIVNNPTTAKGRVYLTPYEKSDTAFCTISKDPKQAKVSGNFSSSNGKFEVMMYSLPADGYVLDCLVPASEYSKGNYRGGNYLGNTEGYPLSSLSLVLDDTTSHSYTTKRPDPSSIRPEWSAEYYSIFVPAKKGYVSNKTAGNLSSVVKSSKYGEATNDLVVTGPINANDLKYLNSLSQSKGLIRLDLSKAKFTTVPDSAFYESGLFELKLPATIEAVGKRAFANSPGLKPVELPEGIVKGDNMFSGCRLMELMGYIIKPEDSSEFYDPLWWLWML